MAKINIIEEHLLIKILKNHNINYKVVNSIIEEINSLRNVNLQWDYHIEIQVFKKNNWITYKKIPTTSLHKPIDHILLKESIEKAKKLYGDINVKTLKRKIKNELS